MTNIFDRAADRLRGRWTKGCLEDEHGNVCLVGAVASVAAGETPPLPHTGRDILERTVANETGCYSAAAFNDAPATTEEDVLLMLKKASALYEERYPHRDTP